MQPEGAVRHARNECDVDTVTRGNACLNFVKEIGAIAENAGADVACDGPAKERREVHLMESAYNAHQGIQVVVHLSREIPRTNVHGTAYDPRLGLWLTVSQRIELERDVPLAAQITARACDATDNMLSVTAFATGRPEVASVTCTEIAHAEGRGRQALWAGARCAQPKSTNTSARRLLMMTKEA